VKNSDANTTPGQKSKLASGHPPADEFDAPATEKLTRLKLLMNFRCM
jgi:hypothetical protein